MMAAVPPVRERTIDGQITVINGHPPVPDAPLASQRAELLGQLVAAQFDLEQAIGELIRTNGGTSHAQSQLQALAQLQRQVGTADVASLLSLRSTVSATVAETQAITQMSRDRANSTDNDSAEALGQRMHRLRGSMDALHRDLFEEKVLDPYLQFDSARDEEEYRKREQERDGEIKRLNAVGTSEAMAKAAAIMTNQLDDAKAHGAAASPDFAALEFRIAENSLAIAKLREAPDTAKSSTNDIGAALAAAGVTTEQDHQQLTARVPDARDFSDRQTTLS